MENAEDSKGDNLEHYTLNSTIEESNKERAQSSIVEFVKNRVIIDRYGNRYEYKICRPILGMILIAIGAFSVGLVSVGIGETCISVLYSKCGIPLRVSAGTSVLVVTIIVFASSLTNIIKNGYGSIPWDLVMFTVPGVIIGGQIGTCVSSKISPYWTAKLLILMFLILAGIMGYETYNKWNS